MARMTIDGATAERIFKAGLVVPPGAQVFTEAEARAFGNAQTSKADPTASLDRGGVAFMPFPFGPGMPITPTPITPRQRDGQPWPRRSEFPVSWNLPGVGAPLVPWRMLRQAADVDVIRRCIELRKAELAYTDWDILPTEDAIETLAVTTGQNNRNVLRKEVIASAKDEIARIKNFFKRPDRINDFAFGDWVATLLEEHLVLDAANVYPWRDQGGSLHSFVVLDGSTIKPLLDIFGNRPQPPNPAFQQIIAGFPRGEFTDMGGADGEFQTTDLIYLPRLRRSFTPYGFSQVEQVLVVLDLWLKRQSWIRAEFTDGVKPETWIKTTLQMEPERLLQYEVVLNELLAGSTEERHRLKVLPDGFDPQETVQFADKYHATYDEFLLKLACMCFDIQPTELGFQPQGGLGGKGFFEQNENITYRRSLRPMYSWLEGVLNDLAIRYLGMPPILTFKFLGFEDENEQVIAQTRSAEQRDGALTINERRAERGLSLFSFPEADEPFIVAGSSVLPIRGLLAQPAPPAPSAPGSGAPDGGASAEGAGGASAGGTPPPPAPPPAKPTGASTDPEAEARKFLAFATKRLAAGRWRPFAFESSLGVCGDDLNAIGERMDVEMLKLATAAAVKAVGGGADPKADRRQLAAKLEKARTKAAKPYATKVQSAFAGMLSPDDLRRAIGSVGVTKAADGPDPSIEEALKAFSHLVDPQSLIEAQSVLVDLWSQGYVGGAAEALSALGLKPTWQLSNWRATAKLLGDEKDRGLAGMLANAEVTISSIAENRLDLLARALAEGIQAGSPVDDLADQLIGILDDPDWAEMVANTEMNRAMSQASLDEYQANGVGWKSWLTASDPCPDCSANEDEGAIAVDDAFESGDDAPPAHPNCLCAVVPIVDDPDA